MSNGQGLPHNRRKYVCAPVVNIGAIKSSEKVYTVCLCVCVSVCVCVCAGHMVLPHSGPSLPPVVAVASQQRVVVLGHFGDTGVPAAQEGVALAAAHVVVVQTPFDVLPLSDP